MKQIRNHVATFMNDVNRPVTMVDRKKASRNGKQKHKKSWRLDD